MSRWRNIAETLRKRIVANHQPDSHLTSVYAVCEEFKVATGTAVRAMGELQTAGYVYSTYEGYFMAATLPLTEREDEQRAVVSALREEATRLQEIADKLDRTI